MELPARRQIHVTIKPAVKIEIAQIGRDHLEIARVVAHHGDGTGHPDLRRTLRLLGDIDDEFVVTANVRPTCPCERNFGLLSRAFEVQKRAAAGYGFDSSFVRYQPVPGSKARSGSTESKALKQ
jgi:hypothetical protein